MWFWIAFGIFVGITITAALFSTLIIASREDDLTEEHYYKKLKEEPK